jgi:hypothetical protein
MYTIKYNIPFKRLFSLLLVGGVCLATEAFALSKPARVTDQNLSQFIMLDEKRRCTCYTTPGNNELGILNRDSVTVGARWSPLRASTLRKVELVVKASRDWTSLSRFERRQLKRMSQWLKQELEAIGRMTRDCEQLAGGGSSTPSPTLTPTPGGDHNHATPTAVPTVAPTQSPTGTVTPRPTSTPSNTATVAPTATPTAGGSTALPPLASSNNRRATVGITTQSIGTPVEALRGGPTRDTFRTRIPWTHLAFDDPIVFPGQPGRSHLHMFFGNALVTANTTSRNIRSQCRSGAAGGTANCSGYWMPALMNAAGEVLAPDGSGFYYKAGYQVSTNNAVVPPQGLAMIEGNMLGAPNNSLNNGDYGWSCNFQGSSRGIPDCPAGGILSVALNFPTCWNGRDLGWEGDHKSHMARGQGGRCPASHPVQIPTITLNAEWRVPSGGTRGLRLSSDMYSVSDSARGGHSMHADWIMGWDPAIMQRFLDNCNNAEIDCVVDNLGDGGYLRQDHQVPMYR